MHYYLPWRNLWARYASYCYLPSFFFSKHDTRRLGTTLHSHIRPAFFFQRSVWHLAQLAQLAQPMLTTCIHTWTNFKASTSHSRLVAPACSPWQRRLPATPPRRAAQGGPCRPLPVPLPLATPCIRKTPWPAIVVVLARPRSSPTAVRRTPGPRIAGRRRIAPAAACFPGPRGSTSHATGTPCRMTGGSMLAHAE